MKYVLNLKHHQNYYSSTVTVLDKTWKSWQTGRWGCQISS